MEICKSIKIFLMMAVLNLLATPLYGYTEPSAKTISWQKVELQEKMRAELSQILKSMIGTEYFVVNVDLKLKKTPQKPPQEQKKEGDTKSLDEDALLLSKLGVLVPAVDKNSDAEKNKLEEPLDLFSMIESITVNCLLDKSVGEDRKGVIKAVLNSHFIQYGFSQVDVTVESTELMPPKVEDPKDEKKDDKEDADKKPETPVEKSFGEKFEPFQIPTSIFLSFLTVMSMMIVVMKAQRKMEAQSAAGAAGGDSKGEGASGEKSESESKSENTVVTTTTSAGDHASSEESAEGIALTVEKFKNLKETNFVAAKILVLEWVNSGNPLAAGTLKYLPSYLTLSDFVQLTDDLEADQKARLKKAMNMSSQDLPSKGAVMEFINAQLLSAVMTGKNELLENYRGFLSSLKAPEIAELAMTEVDLAAGLVNVIPSDLVSDAFKLMAKDNVDALLKQSINFKVNEFVTKIETLIKKIKEIRERSEINLVPVLDSVEVLLESVGPEKEGPLFSALIASKAFNRLDLISKKYFPSELILKLEPQNINSIMMRMPLTTRAEFIYSLNEDSKEVINKVIGSGTRLRELIDTEVESIQADEIRRKLIELNKEKIWIKFVNLSRESIQSNPIIQENAQGLLKVWIDEKRGDNALLKVA